MISRSARSNIEAPLRGGVSHCRDAASSARGRNHAQEHNVALIALESVGVAAYALSPLHLFWTELANEARFDLTRLSIADEADDAECLAPWGLHGVDAMCARSHRESVSSQLRPMAAASVQFVRAVVGRPCADITSHHSSSRRPCWRRCIRASLSSS